MFLLCCSLHHLLQTSRGIQTRTWMWSWHRPCLPGRAASPPSSCHVSANVTRGNGAEPIHLAADNVCIRMTNMPLSPDEGLGRRVRTQGESERRRFVAPVSLPDGSCLRRPRLFRGFCIQRWRISEFFFFHQMKRFVWISVDTEQYHHGSVALWANVIPSSDCSRRIMFLLAGSTRSEARLPPSQAARGPPRFHFR